MNTTTAAGLAAGGATAWIGPFLVGLAVVALLAGIVIRRRGRGRSRPPRPDEQPAATARRAAERGQPGTPGDTGGTAGTGTRPERDPER
ncbi:DUF6479 family protein [Streptomyces sp. NPDC014894]|uniref:DUF6479 family protein n=1 Tax=unclassified Streptomyces TaxID=2593676 RepID=UPI0037002251